ncbi:MAG TPA: flagellar motor switch protein FliM [Candidatus Binatia bacterium]|nr:flagellar motor switch protein FliM [Candidatus Binatia bacterium]
MEKVLSQGEIDALFRAARGEAGGEKKYPADALVETWDVHRAGLLAKEQLRSVSQLHESFARNLSSSAAGYLSDRFDVALVAVEQLAWRDFLARFSETAYYASFRLPPGDGRGVLHIDAGLAFPVIDLLLGGPGQMPQQGTREVTEIEENMLEGIGGVICHELRGIWQPLGVEVEFERRQPVSQMLRIIPPQERTLTLSFDVTMAASRGTLNVAFPSAVCSALMRKLRAELVYQQARGPAVNQESLGRRLLNSRVEIELATPPIPVGLLELASMRRGEVLCLRRRIEEPAVLRMGGRDCWTARPVSSRSSRAAQVLEYLLQPEEKESCKVTTL